MRERTLDRVAVYLPPLKHYAGTSKVAKDKRDQKVVSISMFSVISVSDPTPTAKAPPAISPSDQEP